MNSYYINMLTYQFIDRKHAQEDQDKYGKLKTTSHVMYEKHFAFAAKTEEEADSKALKFMDSNSVYCPSDQTYFVDENWYGPSEWLDSKLSSEQLIAIHNAIEDEKMLGV